jgi:hypothetical protein
MLKSNGFLCGNSAPLFFLYVSRSSRPIRIPNYVTVRNKYKETREEEIGRSRNPEEVDSSSALLLLLLELWERQPPRPNLSARELQLLLEPNLLPPLCIRHNHQSAIRAPTHRTVPQHTRTRAAIPAHILQSTYQQRLKSGLQSVRYAVMLILESCQGC